ncbi:uncharacterized protein LOC105736411 isoform X1 [Apis florea]|uniref:uncharacterized protein LOC105736411 isoform X1 n=1 Tax=Apis florea TaxID=7463 RepID=UPI0012FF0AD1|nr:uncharacterized protein LOC105736411 isoform X1 [Apis florea]
MLTARSGPLGLGVPRTLGPAEGSDHLFLLPERALIMDSTHLRQDLAGLDFNLHLNLLHTAPRGNVWLCEYLIVKGKRVCARASDCFALRYVEREWQGMAELNPYQKLDRVINEFVAFIALDIKHWGGKSG